MPRGGPVPPRGGPVPRGGPLCRKVFCAERIGGGPVSGGGPCAERRPSVLVDPVLCARGLKEALCWEEAHCAEWFDSFMLRELQEAPMPRGGHLCREVLCVERI